MPSSLADHLVIDCSVRTLDPTRPHATAVAVKDGVVVALDQDALELRGRSTQVVDLAGATVTPGLVDGHIHPTLGAIQFEGVDLSGCRNVDELRSRLADAEVSRDGWVQGYGMDHNLFDGRTLTNAVLDQVLPGVPVFIRLYDGHSALASSEALKRAGIDGPREFATRSHIVCDDAGRPTGHVLEFEAMAAVEAVTPPMALEEQRAGTLEVLQAMAASGLTGGNVMDGEPQSMSLLSDLEDSVDLPLRLRIAPWCLPDSDLDELLALQGRGGRRWAVGAVKLFLDGTVEGGTAWLEEPDCHGRSRDAYWRDPAEYTKAVQHLAVAGVQTCTHAIGDAAVRHVVDTLESVETHGVLHRVEHLETAPLGLVQRLVRARLVASMQPSHAAYTRADHADEWSQRLGDQRADRAWVCRDIRDAGGILVLGSDWPIAHYDAREVLSYARLRRPAGTDTPPVAPDQALTGLMALEGMTTHAAIADGAAAFSGRITVGSRADLSAFAVDPVDAPADEFATSPVRLTMSAGVITHRTS
jgi:predicted amidohydrolase YtcJ